VVRKLHLGAAGPVVVTEAVVDEVNLDLEQQITVMILKVVLVVDGMVVNLRMEVVDRHRNGSEEPKRHSKSHSRFLKMLLAFFMPFLNRSYFKLNFY
jgi:hypothetical protein